MRKISFILLFIIFEFKFGLAQYDRSYHLNSNNFADQLTRNYQNPSNQQGQLTEEERTRLNTLSGIKRIDDDVPRADSGSTNHNTFVVTSPLIDNSGDLSNGKVVLQSSSTSSTSSLGHDLTNLPNTRNDPFSERNRLFNKNHNQFPANIHYERPADDINDFSYLYRSTSSKPAQFQQQLQSLNYEQQLKSISDMIQQSTQTAGTIGKNVVDSTKSFVETHRPVIENTVETVKNRVQQTGSYIQEIYQPAVQNVVKNVGDKLQEIGVHIDRFGKPIVNNAFNSTINELNKLPIQEMSDSMQKNYKITQLSMENRIRQGIKRYDTNIPRYASQPPDAAAASRNRIVIDPENPLLNERTLIDSNMRNSPEWNQKATIPSVYDEDREIEKVYSPGQVIGGNSQTVRTKIFTKGSATPVEISEAPFNVPNESINNVNQVIPATKNFTTYPDFKADLSPVLDNQAKVDTRPATGRRLGPQGHFGGGTNEYREDIGKMWAINDRRPPWMKYPGMGGRPETTKSTTPLNRYANQVAIENYPEVASVDKTDDIRRLGDDLTKTDAMGHNQYGPNYLEYTTPVPHSNLGVASTTIIGVPLSENNQMLNGSESHLIVTDINPVSQRIPISMPTDRHSENVPEMIKGHMRPYYGPEEITGSRYRNLDEYFHELNGGDLNRGPNRYVKIDLLNE